jgi:hypothetical protein
MEEIIRRSSSLKAIKVMQPVSPSQESAQNNIIITRDTLSLVADNHSHLSERVSSPWTHRQRPPAGQGIIPAHRLHPGQDKLATFLDGQDDHRDIGNIYPPITPLTSRYDDQPSAHAMEFQPPLKRSVSRPSANDTINKKDRDKGKKKKMRDEKLFIPNALKMDNHFRVACSVATLLLFFSDCVFRGKTSRGNSFFGQK